MKKTLLLLCILISAVSFSQELETGNLIPEYGEIYRIDSPGFMTDTLSPMKVVFDINRNVDPAHTNRLIETAARFLNMHEMAGVNPENMKIALVLHGKAVNDALKDQFYSEKFTEAKKNPNLDLIEALVENGAKVIICGQSATHYEVTKAKITENAQFALSAMTALVQLQNDGYQLINF